MICLLACFSHVHASFTRPNFLSYQNGPLGGQFVDRDYDNLGRLTGLKLSAGVSIGYTYGSDGALATVKTAGGKTGTWSNTDAVTGRGQNFSLGALSTVTGYDGLGRTTSRVSTANGNATSYSSYSYNGEGHCDGYNSPRYGGTHGIGRYRDEKEPCPRRLRPEGIGISARVSAGYGSGRDGDYARLLR